MEEMIDICIPGICSLTRASLSSCAMAGNKMAIECLETIRRVEAGEPIGLRYAKQLNKVMGYEPE